MSNETERLLALMANARVLVAFNSNTDILPSSKLESALKDAEDAHGQGTLEFSSLQAETLRAEVQRMVSAIKPSTIADIKEFAPYTSSRTPRGLKSTSGYSRLIRPVLYSFSTALVIFFCAYLTIWARDAEQFMRAAQNVQQRLASEALQAIVGRWTTVPFIELADAGPWEPSDLRDSPRDFRAMAELLSTFEDIELKTNDLSRRLAFEFGSNPSSEPAGDGRRPEIVGAGEATGPDASDDEAPDAAGPGAPGVQGANPPQPYLADSGTANECLDDYRSRRQEVNSIVRPYFSPAAESDTGSRMEDMSQSALLSWASERMYSIHQGLLTCTLRLSADRAGKLDRALDPRYYIERVREVRNSVDFLSTWVIPGLYGMLGAIFMNLQIQMDPLRPPQKDGRIIIRVLTGGFVGLVIGWFWSPSSSELFDFANINVGLFTVAFLFGYGADVFMNLLQRTTQSLATAVEGGAGRT